MIASAVSGERGSRLRTKIPSPTPLQGLCTKTLGLPTLDNVGLKSFRSWLHNPGILNFLIVTDALRRIKKVKCPAQLLAMLQGQIQTPFLGAQCTCSCICAKGLFCALCNALRT